MIKATIPPEDKDAFIKSYSEAYQTFSWKDMEKEFTWHLTGDVNIVQEAVDRWASDREKRDRKALIFEKAGQVKEFTYKDLRELSSQLANLLIEHGFAAGDRIFIFLPPCPEIYLTMLACARLGVIFSPLYSSHSFDELETRFQDAKPRAIVTHPDLVERLPQHAMSGVNRVFLTEGPLPNLFEGEVLLWDAMKDLPKKSTPQWLRGTSPLYLIYTSGSTGPPKGVVHAHQDMMGILMTARSVLDLNEQSVLWTDGPPGWVTNTVYGALAPWLCGAATVVLGDPFAASTWYRTLEKHRVTTWYTSPRIVARLMEAGEDLPARYDFSHLSHIATVGEALTSERFFWVRQTLKHSPHDTWWMTETGMICMANFRSMITKPGSMGKPVPGVQAAVIDENGDPVPAMTMGELALRPGWPSMMTGIWNDAPRYQAYFRFREWFLTGDMVIRDEDGYYYHQGRNDDLIKIGDKFVGPYEIEQVLLLHPAVAEAVAISLGSASGKTIVRAFVTVNKGYPPSSRLNHELRTFVKANFAYELPLSEVVFMDELPKTRSGKLLRRVLRARELGLPSGDTMKLRE